MELRRWKEEKNRGLYLNRSHDIRPLPSRSGSCRIAHPGRSISKSGMRGSSPRLANTELGSEKKEVGSQWAEDEGRPNHSKRCLLLRLRCTALRMTRVRVQSVIGRHDKAARYEERRTSKFVAGRGSALHD